MILLDTNAVIWIVGRHARARRLAKLPRLFVSPATLLEIQFLEESGRLRVDGGRAADVLGADPRWKVDDPSAVKLFAAATDLSSLSGTRDPFDRLIVAHARLRGWKLATGDDRLLEELPASKLLPL